MVPDVASEYRLRPPTKDCCDRSPPRPAVMAARSDALPSVAGAHQVSRHALWPWLVFAALLLFLPTCCSDASGCLNLVGHEGLKILKKIDMKNGESWKA